MKKNKRNFKSKLHLASSKDDLRETMQKIIFENGYVITTDAHVLVKQKLSAHGFSEEEVKHLEGKSLNRETFAEILRYDWIEVIEGFIIAVKGKIKVQFELDLKGSYPRYEQIIPTEGNECEINEIGFDLNLMKLVNDVTLSDSGLMKTKFYGKNKPIILSGTEFKEGEELILLMPINL